MTGVSTVAALDDRSPGLVPEEVHCLGLLNLARLADAFTARIDPEPGAALKFLSAVLPAVPPQLHLALGRLIDSRLGLSACMALRTTPEGRRFLFHRFIERTRKPTLPPVPNFTPQLAFDQYASLVLNFGSTGARHALSKGQVVLLGLRRESSTLAHRGLGSYDDQIVVLNGLGASRWPRVFAACTEPGAQYSQRSSFKTVGVPQAPGAPATAPATTKVRVDARYAGISFRKSDGADINNDGIKDAGRLTAGTYQYFEKPGGFLGARAFQVKVTQRVERDTDGDGRFTDSDPSRIDPSGAGTSMYIHRGGPDNTAQPNTWSAGCQTIPGNVYAGFLSALGPAQSFHYVLIDTVLA